jgi:hypothetical protein
LQFHCFVSLSFPPGYLFFSCYGIVPPLQTSEVNQRQFSHRPVTTFEKHSMPTRIHIKGTHMMDKKDTNRFDRRSYLHTQRLLPPRRASSIRCTRYYLVWSSLPKVFSCYFTSFTTTSSPRYT